MFKPHVLLQDDGLLRPKCVTFTVEFNNSLLRLTAVLILIIGSNRIA